MQELGRGGVGVDHLTIADYLWRWDTDWFWCSRALGVQNPVVRRLWPARYRRSDVYRRLVALDRRVGLSQALAAARAPRASSRSSRTSRCRWTGSRSSSRSSTPDRHQPRVGLPAAGARHEAQRS